LIEYLCVRYFKKTIKDILFGYGPLEDLIRMPIISEIMVVNSDKIYIEKSGKLQNSRRRFVSDEVTITIIKRIVSKVNRHIDKSTPLVDARLSDGSRVNAIIDPLAVSGPCLTIRKFPETRIRVEDLVRIGSLTIQAAEFLQASVVNRRNIIVSGGTGSGKTTLLNCLGDYIPDNERIITIEDTAELNLKKDHLVRLETRDANIEGKGAYTIRDLVRNSLRMRPDRIIVGECRGPETLDMLQAMNTGHDGSLTTIHANSAEDVVLRLEVLVQMAADLPIASIHQQIVSAIDLVVQLKRLKNGRRCVSQIAEVANIDPQTKRILLRNLYLLDSENDEALLTPTGSLPSYMNILMERNLIQLNNFFA
jgi:Flp pilus assembly CpaF family ATPase